MAVERRFRVCGEGLELTIKLDEKWQARPFVQAVVLPFVKKYNSRAREDQPAISVEALKSFTVDGAEVRLADAKLPAADVVPVSAARVDLAFGEPPPTEMKLRVCCGETSVRVSLDSKWLSRPLGEAVVRPFLSVYNKKARVPRTVDQLIELRADGTKLPSAKDVLALPTLEALGPHCTEVALFFSYEEVHAASSLPAPTWHYTMRGWNADDFRQSVDLVWDHQGFNRADGEEMAKAIVAAGVLRKLKYVYLYGNQLGDEGVGSLARALRHEHMPELKELHLHSNRIGSAGLVAFARKCSPSPRLALLSLHDNNIGDEGVAALAGAIGAKTFTVERVTLHANAAITAAGRQTMAAACAGADFATPTPERGPTPFIPMDHTPQRWLEKSDVS